MGLAAQIELANNALMSAAADKVLARAAGETTAGATEANQPAEQAMTAVDYILAAQAAWEAHDRAHRTGNRELIKATLQEWAIAAEQRRLYGG